MALPDNILIERVRCCVEFGIASFEDLDDGTKTPPANPIGWLKKGEAWVSAATWLNAIFEGNEEDATRAAQLMRDVGLLRTQNSCSLHDHTIQCVTTIKGRPRRIYVVRRADLKGYLHGKYNTAQLNLDRKLIGFPINRPFWRPYSSSSRK
jgi:hypothetical protein